MLLQGKGLSTEKDEKTQTDILLVFIKNKSQTSSLNSELVNTWNLCSHCVLTVQVGYQNPVIKHQKYKLMAGITQKQPKVVPACELEHQTLRVPQDICHLSYDVSLFIIPTSTPCQLQLLLDSPSYTKP